MEYLWNKQKAESNLKKHGVDFADAIFVLEDELAITLEDRDHTEERFITLGQDAVGRLLVVVYAYEAKEIIRIISARKATKAEMKNYQTR